MSHMSLYISCMNAKKRFIIFNNINCYIVTKIKFLVFLVLFWRCEYAKR